jgi:hypothetical protein
LDLPEPGENGPTSFFRILRPPARRLAKLHQRSPPVDADAAAYQNGPELELMLPMASPRSCCKRGWIGFSVTGDY